MATVLLVRHGRTTANTSGVLAGRSAGVRLDEVGVEQAARTGDRRLLDGWARRLRDLHRDVHDARQRLLVEQAQARLRRAEAP
jgi:broad specificity phosphatase PhoE